MRAREANFDGLVGPTHNYAGLSFGNVAPKSNSQTVSYPKKAALQGLAKMKALSDMGLVQGVLAPQQRPDINSLKRLGFTGSDSTILKKVLSEAPYLLSAVSSASSMWTANAATVSPSADTEDNKIHFTPANLTNKFHRSIEVNVTGNILKSVFSDVKYFCHHKHLPENDYFGDEGAANHTRFCAHFGDHGVELFVYGKSAFNEQAIKPAKYPARQTLEASQAIARLHQLDNSKTVFAQQNPHVIDQGVFHNDVIAVGTRNVLFHHQQAFLNTTEVYSDIERAFGDHEFHFICVDDNEVAVPDAVSSYLFNTQLVELPTGNIAIIAPVECRENTAVFEYLTSLVESDSIIDNVRYFDVKQSMQNGGGPACLRLRVVLNDAELNATNSSCLINEQSYSKLCQWVERHYRDRLIADDLADPALLDEVYTALDELTQILNLGIIYPFQQ